MRRRAAAAIRGADRRTLDAPDRLIQDRIPRRRQLAPMIRL
jgi:hypothetical protein